MKQQYRLLPWKVITSGFGLGYVPFAPGTMGSLGALISAVIILRFSSQPYVIISALFIVFAILGMIGAGKLRHVLGKDPPVIVADEMAVGSGFLATLGMTHGPGLSLFFFIEIVLSFRTKRSAVRNLWQ